MFLGFQLRFFDPLGPSAWVLGVIIFSLILWLIGRGVLPRRQPPEFTEIWYFTVAFAIVATVVIAYGGLLLGMVPPAAFVLSVWLIIFGAGTFVTGWTMKWGVTTATGVIWLFASTQYAVPSLAANAYLHFALVTSLPFIIYGLITKG